MLNKAAPSPAYSSGMRGSEEPPAATELSPGEQMDASGDGAEDNRPVHEQMQDYIHGPDENGDHHLNLTQMMRHGKKHGHGAKKA